MPTVEEARKMLIAELQSAKQSGIAATKLIHGYGSTGAGGALRPALRKSLLRRKKESLVSQIIFGEKWASLSTTPGTH
jgi:DNA-nicking Smr family endonuclease